MSFMRILRRFFNLIGRIAHLVERGALNLKVASSTLAAPMVSINPLLTPFYAAKL